MTEQEEFLLRLAEEKLRQIVGIEAEYHAKRLKAAFEMQALMADCLRAGISWSEAARRLNADKGNFHRMYRSSPTRGPIAEYYRKKAKEE